MWTTRGNTGGYSGPMWRWLRKTMDGGGQAPNPGLLRLGADEVAPFLFIDHGLPHVDWDMAQRFAIGRSATLDMQEQHQRAVAAVWLDAVAGQLRPAHGRWSRGLIEGLAPENGDGCARVARAVDHAVRVVGEAMQRVTGESRLLPVAVVLLQRQKDYYSFIAPFYEDEGEFATSGGIYVRSHGWSFPVIVMPLEGQRWSVESTIAHELTHHALACMDMPLWVEEGLTQMMEERVTGTPSLRVEFDTRERHARHWDKEALERFWMGDAFESPHGDETELAYHLAQVLVRGLLTARAEGFFAFARAAKREDGGEAAAREHLGMSLEEVAANITAGR